jgi:pyridoxal phosphate enzyme (YggS family)
MPASEDLALARIAGVRAEVAAVARRIGRDPAGVRIVAVTKTFSPAAVALAVEAGLTDVGENYVQEARAKRAACSVTATWHLVGGLQGNKARAAAVTFDRIHTLDSQSLAAALGRAAAAAARRLPVLVQVNLSGQKSQRGARPDDVSGIVEAALREPALAVDGLMTIGPAGASAEVIRAHFREVRRLRDAVAGRLGVELPHLSMGMSGDFSLAVEEGATFVRLGRLLFGPRGSGTWREGS